MKIGIDARFLTHPQKGGFKTYTENLISAIAEVDADNSYFLYLDRPPNHHTKLPKQHNFEYRVIPGKIPIIGMPTREQIYLPYFIAKDRLDLFHSPCLSAPLCLNRALSITIHDMFWFSYPYTEKSRFSLNRKLMNWYYYILPQLAARKSSLIITVSKASKDSIIRELGIPDEKIIVTYEGTNRIFRQIFNVEQIRRIRTKYNLTSDYIMGIGSTDPRKNISGLVQSYAHLPANLKTAYQLVIIWTNKDLSKVLMRQVEDLGLNERVCFLSQVSDEDLVLLYNGASLFTYPTLGEGFGLPILEAMACGTPVVAANNSSVPEIAGDAAILFNSADTRDLIETISKVLNDGNLKSELSDKGLKRANEFSWERCAKETIHAYRSIVKENES